MTVSTQQAVAEYLENGVVTEFAVNFRFLQPSDLIVTRRVDGVTTPVAPQQVTGAGAPKGGTVKLSSSVAGATLRITRRTARVQPTDYTPGDDFPAESHELALDRQMLALQETDADLADLSLRALQVPPGEVAPNLPSKGALAGKFLAGDANGNLIPAQPPAPGTDAALRADLAADLGAALVRLKGKAPGEIGRTLRDWHDGFIDPGRFGAVMDGTVDDTAALQDVTNFITELTQAAEPTLANPYPLPLFAARRAKRLSLRGRALRVTQPITVPRRKLDRTNTILMIRDGAFVRDGDFTLFESDEAPPLNPAGQPTDEFMTFRDVVFWNEGGHAAPAFDQRFFRMRFEHCEFVGMRCLDAAQYFAQEWTINHCMARLWSGGPWFRAQGGYWVTSALSKWQNGGDNVFEMNSAQAGVVGSQHVGFIVEANNGHFLRLGQIQSLGLFGGYSEKNLVQLLNFECLPGGQNRGLGIYCVQSDPTALNRADPNFYEFRLGPGGATLLDCHSTGNMVDNSLCGFGEVKHLGLRLFDPINNKLFKNNPDRQFGLIPDPSGGYGAKITASVCVVTPVNGVVGHAVSLPKPRAGRSVLVIGSREVGPPEAFTVNPSDEADGSRFAGGNANEGIVHPAQRGLNYDCSTDGVWEIVG